MLVGFLAIAQDLVEVVRDWQRLVWFPVQGSEFVYVHNIGVQPGDQVAGILFAFCLCFLAF